MTAVEPEVGSMRNLTRLSLSVFRILWIAGMLFLTACATGQGGGTSRENEARRKSLVGRWKKTSTSECARLYPDEIEFHELATYLGKKGPNQSFIVWDAGGYKVADENHLVISIATDEMVSYKYTITKDTLKFVDGQGCEYTYQRIE